MTPITSLKLLSEHLASQGRRWRIAVVWGTDHSTLAAVTRAVELIRDGKADILMKGLVGTDVLLRAVLDKETGLLPAGRVLTHMAVTEWPEYGKLLFFTDAAAIPT